ncbi:MAG TPA: zinc ribbon domain-containing protein [Pyrinomonadaceae bacterium]|jgi:hypothetical protein
MSEFIAVMGASGSEYTVAEHTTRRVLSGEAEEVRARLVYALESLGYVVVSDSPLQARRARRKDIVRADFTDHARRVSVGLRRAGASATQATFDFAVTHGGFTTKGDLLTLEREADAVAALAAAPPPEAPCRSCGTENGGDARFCRLCGAPNAAGEPAEMEVLRLTAGGRAALQEIFGGLLLALLVAAVTAPLMLLGKPKVANVMLALFAVGQAAAWGMTLYGVLRLHRTLKPGTAARTLNASAPAAAAAATAPVLPTPRVQTSALLPPSFSVTDATTELLATPAPEREPVPVRRAEPRDTGPLG